MNSKVAAAAGRFDFQLSARDRNLFGQCAKRLKAINPDCLALLAVNTDHNPVSYRIHFVSDWTKVIQLETKRRKKHGQ